MVEMKSAAPRAAKVSVVMPFLNTPERFLREAVDSVRCQSHVDWELLLVDDGSRQEIGELARHLADEDSARIRYLQHDRPGTYGSSRSRNLGLSFATGEFVSFLDSDDVWLADKLAEQLQILAQYPDAGMLFGNTLYWYSWTDSGRSGDRDYSPKLGIHSPRLFEPPSMLRHSLQGRIAVPCINSLLCRRNVLHDENWFEDSFTGMYDDQVLYAKFWINAPVIVVDRCWDKYRQHRDSMTAGGDRAEEHSIARRQYLEWIGEYLEKRSVYDANLMRTLAFERSISRYTKLGSLIRKGRRHFWQIMPSLR